MLLQKCSLSVSKEKENLEIIKKDLNTSKLQNGKTCNSDTDAAVC